MNRTDRLYALVDDLRAHAPRLVRAADLARRFEVTTRTIERDLLALQEAGVPIWAQPGPGGGYSLQVDSTLPPLNLSPGEAAAVATALAATRAMPFAEAGRSALRKLAAVMAAVPRDQAQRLVSQIRVLEPPRTDTDTSIADTVQAALLEARAIALTYRAGDDRVTTRVVEPAGIIGTAHGWYLVGWCRLRQAPRAFRLDRIATAELTTEAIAPRPLDDLLPDFHLALTEPALL
jgi:predicted DNA-binding transcriptional regulator YafY